MSDGTGEDPDDDWFERAVESEDDPTAGESADPPDPEDQSAGPPDPDADDREGGADDGDPHAGDGGDADDAGEDPDDGDPGGDPDDGVDAAGFESAIDDAADANAPDATDANAPDASAGDREDGEALFGDDFETAMQEAPGAAGPGSPGGGMAEEFGVEEDLGVGDDFGMGGGDFGMGGGDFGMGGVDDGFEEEAVETDIARIDLGIEGLDEMIQLGVPERSLMVVIGSAGTGKTTFGIQFLNEELQKDDGGNAVFITLEESSERIVNSAVEKGYPFDEYTEDGRLAIVDLDPVEMTNSLATIRSELPRLIEEFDAERLVLDSVSLLEMMYDDRATRRNEIYDFTRSLKNSGVTTMLTSEARSDSPYASRYGIVEYLTDAVFVLQYVRPSDFRKTRLAVEIQKIRDANHSRETKPYEITNEGISVYRQANIF